MWSQDSFYKALTPAQHNLAHKNEYDLDSPQAIDFDLLVERLRDLKRGCVYFLWPIASARCSNLSQADVQIFQCIHSKTTNAKNEQLQSIRLMYLY